MSEPLSPEETAILARVLDAIVPPSADGRMPGAGELGLATHIEAQLAASADLRTAVMGGIAALAQAGFAALAPEASRAALDAVVGEQPAFLPGLIFHTYLGYYQHGRVLEGLGLEPRPPFPEGYAMEPADLALLEPVRQRPPMYR